jgi:hypothetical protein
MVKNIVKSYCPGNKLFLSLIVLLILFVLSSCDSTSAPRFEGEVYSLAGLLRPGFAISADCPVYISKSNSIAGWDPFDLFVTDAEVDIFELDSGINFSLQAQIDMQTGQVKWVDPAEHIIQAGSRYRIEVRIPGYEKLISAETQVPPLASLVRDYYGHNVPGEGYGPYPDNIPQLVYELSDIRYPLALDLGENGGVYNLMAELFCMEEFSTELEYTTPILGTTNPTEDMESAYNSAGEGLRRIQFLGRFTAQEQPEREGNYILLRDYRQGFIFYGRYSVSMMITDDNYYRYSYMPEGYLHGGVQNALGYFGSASGDTMYSRIVKSTD